MIGIARSGAAAKMPALIASCLLAVLLVLARPAGAEAAAASHGDMNVECDIGTGRMVADLYHALQSPYAQESVYVRVDLFAWTNSGWRVDTYGDVWAHTITGYNGQFTSGWWWAGTGQPTATYVHTIRKRGYYRLAANYVFASSRVEQYHWTGTHTTESVWGELFATKSFYCNFSGAAGAKAPKRKCKAPRCATPRRAGAPIPRRR
jgi:hypothetical protein